MTTRVAIAAALDEVVEGIVAIADATGVRPTVVACWQDAAYVGSPPGLLDRLAAHADVVVACVGRPLLAAGIAHAPLDADDWLVREWSLTALTPVAGLHFVAHDVGTSLPASRVEDGRAFSWELSTDPADLVARAHRVARELGARVPPAIAASLGSATRRLGDVRAGTATGASTGVAGASGQTLHARVARRIEAADDARRRSATTPPAGGGLTALADWLTDAGPLSPALGMIVVQCDGHAVTASLRARAHTLGRVGDLIVDVPPDAAMIVMPGLVGDGLQQRTSLVRDTVAAALDSDDVHALGAEVSAVEARVDLVGSLGRALVHLRTAALTG